MKLSDLNENDYQVESNTSEEAPLSLSSLSESDYQVESPEEVTQPEEAALTPITDQIIAPATGYMAGRTAQEAISTTGEFASRGLEKIAQLGGTSPEQLKTIKQNFPEFKAIDPIAETNKLLATARGTNVGINKMYQEAEKLLTDKKITPDEYRSLVEKAALEQNQYGQPTFAKPISQSEIRKLETSTLVDLQKEALSKEEKLLNELAELKANEAIKKADFEYKITNATNQPLPKSIESELKSDVINRVKSNPQEFGFKGVGEEILGDYKTEVDKRVSRLETPLAKEFPSLKGTSVVPSEERAFQKILAMPSKADIPGNRLQEMLREFRDVGFTEQGQLSEKPAAAMSTKVREKISELSPEAGNLMEAENVELSKLEGLEKAGYVKREGAGLKTTIEMTDAQRNNLIKDLSTSYDKASPTDVVENLEVLKKYLPEDQFKKLELAGLKLAEKRGGGVDYINANKINAILQSITKRSVSRAVATLPEAISSALPKAVTSTAKFLGKGAYKLLPAVGAGLGGIAAQAAEEGLSPETSGALPTEVETEDRRNAPIPANQQELDRIKSTYWFEKGYTPEEQLQKARLASFKEGLPAGGKIDEMPSAYEKPEIRQRKEQVMAAKKAGALAPTYVEAPKMQVLKADNPAEIASMAQALQLGQDKASQEYGRVLSQIIDAPAREKESILFGLNQQPAFRELVRKAKGEQNTEEETPLMLRGPA
jgi:hypothetical protein